jgi:uncharacterized membrane protein YwaF
MKTIAILTMLFLPATFISGLFGTNFFALSISPSGSSTFVVSDQWWVFLATSVPLTMVVMAVWQFWQIVIVARVKLARKKWRVKLKDAEKGVVEDNREKLGE